VRIRAIAAILAALLMSACGSDQSEPPPDPSATASEASPSSSEPTPVAGTKIRFKDGNVRPRAERVKAKVGEPVVLLVTSDTKDELHVHSSPEQTHDVSPGMKDKAIEITIDQPGQVAIESHELGVVIVQLVVRP
jgi:hypothetical protein